MVLYIFKGVGLILRVIGKMRLFKLVNFILY